MRIGAHVGVGRGWVAAVDYAESVGAECIQVFSKSPRMWRASPLPDEATGSFADAMSQAHVAPLLVHTSYLINLGSGDSALREKSVAALAVELDRAGLVGASGLVTHLGTDPFDDKVRAAAWIADAVASARAAAGEAGGEVELLLENAAGAGRHFGATATEIGGLFREIAEREAGPVGVCLDTCHAFAAGYGLADASDWTALLDEIDEACGEAAVRLIHANDCLYGVGEHRDRHAWIGDGAMGEPAFRTMFAMERLEGTPVIIEMPGDPPQKDQVNIERLKRLRNEARGDSPA